MKLRSMMLAIASLVAGAAGCAEEERLFECAAWCADDASDVEYRLYSAPDEGDAQEQCWADWSCSDMPGQILKCMCEAQ